MAGTEQHEEKPVYKREAWIDDFKRFGKRCPKMNLVDYEDEGITREEACDHAHRSLYTIAEFMLGIKNSMKPEDVPASDRTYVTNDFFLGMMADCGNGKCGDCVRGYLQTKTVLGKELKPSEKNA
jgi:hypothetical protein